MSNFKLRETGGTNIQTTFRFELAIAPDPNNSALGLTDAITAYIQSTDLPSATGEPIIWSLPGGMKNHQAGKRTIKPISMEFVIPTGSTGSIYKVLEKWGNATYDLNTGVNTGKGRYTSDGVSIKIKGEDDQPRYIFRLLKAQPTEVSYGTVNSEGNELLKVSCTWVYDNYELTDGNGIILRGLSAG
jgi:hypothetical protein